jgi:hypothetical protein
LLKVQEYLAEHTLEDLKQELAIKFSYDAKEELVVLNYNQIESPKTHPITLECRSLILEVGTWNIVSMAFRRFFNANEVPELNEDFNYSNAYALDKIDGSIIQVFQYKDEWRMSTRGMIDGTGPVGLGTITFKELFDSTAQQYDLFNKLNPEITYIFELVSPENRVVTRYENRELYLLGGRARKTFQELGIDDIENKANRLGVPCPKKYSMNDLKEVENMAKALPQDGEGYVIVDYSKYLEDGISHPRIKVKNPMFVALHHLKDSIASSMNGLMQVVIKGEEGEFLSHFPEYNEHVKTLKDDWISYLMQIETDWLKVAYMRTSPHHRDSRKDFALAVKDSTAPSVMFSLYDYKAESVRDYFSLQSEKIGSKNLAKRMLKILNISDKEFIF